MRFASNGNIVSRTGSLEQVRAYLSYTCLVLPVGSVSEPECEALHNIGYKGLGMCHPNGLDSFSSQYSRTGYLF